MLKTWMLASLIPVLIVSFGGCNLPEKSQEKKESDPAALTTGVGKFKGLFARYGEIAGVSKAEITVVGAAVRSIDGTFYHYDVQPEVVDLMSLNAGMGLSFLRGLIPVGEYDHIRLKMLPEGQLTFSDGSVSAFDIPSGEESGLKIFFDAPLQVVEGALSVLVIETDLMDSFVFTGSGAVHFKPVLRVIALAPIVLPETSVESDPADAGSSTDVGDGSGDVSSDPVVVDAETDSATDPASDPVVDEVPIEESDSIVSPPDYVDTNFSPWTIGV